MNDPSGRDRQIHQLLKESLQRETQTYYKDVSVLVILVALVESTAMGLALLVLR
jgi:hypothetical protein